MVNSVDRRSNATPSGSSVRAHYVGEGVENYYRNNFYQNPHEGRVNELLKICWTDMELESRLEKSGVILDLSAGNGEVTNALMEIFGGESEVTNAMRGRIVGPTVSNDLIMEEAASDEVGQEDNIVDQHQKPDISTLDGQQNADFIVADSIDVCEPKRKTRVYDLPFAIEATDPFTHSAYEKRFKDCRWRVNEEKTAVLSTEEATRDVEMKEKDRENSIEKARKLICFSVSFEDIIEGQLLENRYELVICSYAMHLASSGQLPVLAMNLSFSSRLVLIITPHKRPILEEVWGWSKVSEIVHQRTRAVLYESRNLY